MRDFEFPFWKLSFHFGNKNRLKVSILETKVSILETENAGQPFANKGSAP